MRSALMLLLAGAATTAAAEPVKLPFTDGRWKLEGAARVERYEGRDVLSLETGGAGRPDVQLQDGTVEFDVVLTRRRSFVYLNVRMAGEREYEEFYLRPHKALLPDAVQYAPVLQGQSAWQLFHGPGGTAAVDFTPGAWTHVKVVLQGRRAALFVGDMKAPAMVVPHMAREPQAGPVGLKAFLPPGTPGEGPIARFADLVLRPGEVDYDFSKLPEPAALPPGLVRSWAVSAARPPSEAAVPAPPEAAAFASPRVAEVEPQGFLYLHRHVALPAASRAGHAAARVQVKAATAGVRALDLGFSDIATVFLNGKPLFRGDQHYSFDNPRRDGVLGFDHARLFLPLQEGDNELVVVVSDSFGGWALQAAFLDPAGLTVTAR